MFKIIVADFLALFGWMCVCVCVFAMKSHPVGVNVLYCAINSFPYASVLRFECMCVYRKLFTQVPKEKC